MSSKKKTPTKLAQPVVKSSAKLPLKSNINEAKASVSSTALAPATTAPSTQAIEISSDSSSNYDDISDLDDGSDSDAGERDHSGERPSENAPRFAERFSPDNIARLKAQRQVEDADTDMLSPPHTQIADTKSDEGEDSDAESTAAPTFGDLVRHAEPVDVTAALAERQEPTPNSLVQANPSLAPPSLSSLGTVINQALRTDDVDLLESCLQTTDIDTVRNTIQRMDSALAGTLLKKLAMRISRRPGRAHSLMGWVQWTVVAHGGALASQPDMVEILAKTRAVLDERARALNSLLALKGKVDMLEAQMKLKRENRLQQIGANQIDSDDEVDDDEAGVIFVEGQDEMELPNGVSSARADPDDIPIANGVDSSEDDSEGENEDIDDDDELAVSDGESVDGDEVDHDDVDDSGEEDDSEVEPTAPPPKVQKTGKAFSTRR